MTNRAIISHISWVTAAGHNNHLPPLPGLDCPICHWPSEEKQREKLDQLREEIANQGDC